jgi:hypothetical protein
MPEYAVALRFATVLSESGTEGRGGAVEEVVDAVAVGAVLLFEPVSPARLLVTIVPISPTADETDQPRHLSRLRSFPMALAARVKT